MRLLLAEDETELSEALVAILKHNNYSVDAVYNGEDALNYLEADNYDGAILDIMMPKMDGITVLKNIRAQGKLDVLFERFYRLDSSRNSGTGGSGIGLSVAQEIVQAHKGKISAENKTGNGLTITVLL